MIPIRAKHLRKQRCPFCGLTMYFDDGAKTAYQVALLTERRDLIQPHPAARPWREDKQSHVQPDPPPIHPLDPKQAEAVFMSTVTLLGLQ
jgi:hypothetical protein